MLTVPTPPDCGNPWRHGSALVVVCGWALVAWGCTSSPPLKIGEDSGGFDSARVDGPDSGPADGRPPGGDSAASPGPPVDVTTVDVTPPSDDWIFTFDQIHTIEIELPHESWQSLVADPYGYVPGSFAIDGQRLDEVGVRVRGKIGSLRPLTGKPKFKIDFNHLVEDQRFYGLESLSLNSNVADCSYLKEVMSARVYADAGISTSRTSYARVTVNDADYGLYVIVETQDDRFLKRYMADPSGNLYDGKYIWYGGSSYTLLDFAEGNDSLFQLEEGDSVDNTDIMAVSNALSATRGTEAFYATLGELLDWEYMHRAWAAEQWVGQNDGYCINKNNYRIYFDPEDGRMRFIPWDNDNSFLFAYQWGRNWGAPVGNLASACLAHAECRADWATAVQTLLGELDPEALAGFVTQIDTLTIDAAVTDPRRECDAGSVAPSRAHVAWWVTARSAEMAAAWGL